MTKASTNWNISPFLAKSKIPFYQLSTVQENRMNLSQAKKYRIALMVDHKWRDLPGYALLKVVLEKKYDCSVTLYPSGWDRQFIPRISPHLLLLPHISTSGLTRLAYWARNHGVLIGIL